MHNIKYWYNRAWVRVLQHILFVAVSFFILLHIFKIDVTPKRVDYVYTLLFMATILPIVYINLKILLPRLGKKLPWYFYALLLIAVTAFFVWINIRLFDDWSVTLFKDLFFISYYTWWEIVLFFIAFIILTTLLKLSKSWFAVTDLQQRVMAIEKERVDMELLALKAQVNPHFFFNTLNSIYSLSLHKDDRLPSTVLQLSGIMRYFLYESKADYVVLNKEIDVLRDYVELQRMRSSDNTDIRFRTQGDLTDKKIAPLLLVTFIENAFKHGGGGEQGKSFIHLDAEVKANDLYFTLKNNKAPIDTIDMKEFNGIGLENVRRRLALLYPGRHKLSVQDNHETFTIDLKINL